MILRVDFQTVCPLIKEGHFVLRWVDLNFLFSYCVKNHTFKQHGSIVNVDTALATAAGALAFAGEQSRSCGAASGQFVPGALCRAWQLWHSTLASMDCVSSPINPPFQLLEYQM